MVVRVVIGSQEAGEFRVFKGVTRRAWRPFKAIEVNREGVATLVRFTEDEIAEAADLAVPAELQPSDSAPATVPPAPLSRRHRRGSRSRSSTCSSSSSSS